MFCFFPSCFLTTLKISSQQPSWWVLSRNTASINFKTYFEKRKLKSANYISLLGKMLSIQSYLQSHPWKLLNMFNINILNMFRSSQTGDRTRYVRKVLNLQKVSLGYGKSLFRHQTFVFLTQIFCQFNYPLTSICYIHTYYVFIHKHFNYF